MDSSSIEDGVISKNISSSNKGLSFRLGLRGGGSNEGINKDLGQRAGEVWRNIRSISGSILVTDNHNQSFASMSIKNKRGVSDLSSKKTSSTKVLPVVSDPQILAHKPISKPKVSRSNKGIDKTIKLVQRYGASVSVNEKFTLFNVYRTDQKQRTYYTVMSYGCAVFVVGLVSFFVGYMLEVLFIFSNSIFIVSSVLNTLGICFMITGIVIMGTLPVNEVDLDELLDTEPSMCNTETTTPPLAQLPAQPSAQLKTNENCCARWHSLVKEYVYRRRKYLVSLLFGTLAFLGGIEGGSFPPYIGFLLILVSLWTFYPLVFLDSKSPFNIVIKAVVSFQIVLLTIGSLLLVEAFSPSMVVEKNIFKLTDNEAWRQWEDNFAEHKMECEIFYSLMSLVFFIGFFYSVGIVARHWYFNRDFSIYYSSELMRAAPKSRSLTHSLSFSFMTSSDSGNKGYPTHLFYGLLYICFACGGIFNVAFGIFNIYVAAVSDFISTIPYFYISFIVRGIVALVPLVIRAKLGDKKMFSLMARYFEFNIETLLNDAAFMAALVSTSKQHKPELIHWVMRAKPLHYLHIESMEERAKCVHREYFMKGVVKGVEHSDECIWIELEVSYKDDVENSWRGKFSKHTINIESVPLGNETATEVVPSFADWVDHYIPQNENYKLKFEDKSNLKVLLLERLNFEGFGLDLGDVGDTLAAQAAAMFHLKEWAAKELRVFNFKYFHDEIMKNPLRQDGVKMNHYPLSKHFIVTNTNRIDYFISHSWSDDAEAKCVKLRSFADEFYKKNQRTPTFWLDKVCIDQNRMNEPNFYAFEVLPINIASCNMILVLLGSTYMTRLWCLWELYCLFTFCNTELALERIDVEIVVSGDSAGREKLFEHLESFSLDNAHCFSPIEETKLRRIIYDVGEKVFCDKILKMIKILKERYNRKKGYLETMNEMVEATSVAIKQMSEYVVEVSEKMSDRIRRFSTSSRGTPSSSLKS